VDAQNCLGASGREHGDKSPDNRQQTTSNTPRSFLESSGYKEQRRNEREYDYAKAVLNHDPRSVMIDLQIGRSAALHEGSDDGGKPGARGSDLGIRQKNILVFHPMIVAPRAALISILARRTTSRGMLLAATAIEARHTRETNPLALTHRHANESIRSHHCCWDQCPVGAVLGGKSRRNR